jgi:hypothetical protein
MPSPFPGMDPYLEGALWTSVHTQLSLEIARELAPLLHPRYLVRTPRQFVMSGADVVPEVVPNVTIEIRDSADHQLVTAIEVLSPSNKRGQGRKDYIARRDRFLLSTVHLMEIDFLRTGERVPMGAALPPHPYFVLLSRGDRRPMTEAWPIALSDHLPKVPIPLLAGDADVPVDLQKAFTSMYDIFAYDLDIDYSLPPEIPLRDDEWEWTKTILGNRKRP